MATIIGGGPAGLGVLCAIIRHSCAHNINPQICLVETRPVEQAGRLADFHITSDTIAQKFLACLDGLPREIIDCPTLLKRSAEIRDYGQKAAPLPLVGEFVRALSVSVYAYMEGRGWLCRMQPAKVISARQTGIGWEIRIASVQGDKLQHILSNNLILATGASEEAARFDAFLQEWNMCRKDLRSYLLSSEVFKADVFEADVFEVKGLNTSLENLNTPKIADKNNPRISIIGGSHSAMAAAVKLLRHDSSLTFGSGGIEIFYREPMQATWATPDAARAAGCYEFGPDDICPTSGRVFALKGFRLDCRNLFLSIKGYAGRALEKRVKLTSLAQMTVDKMKQTLGASDLVISALGYRPDYIALFDQAGQRFNLNKPRYVDSNARLLECCGTTIAPIKNVYALGLSANQNLAGQHGEPSFTGQANGFVLWFEDIGTQIAEQIFQKDV